METTLQDTPPTTFGRAEVNGVRIYYRMAGSGEPVVLLHGFPETSNAWRKVMPALAEHYTVLAPDLRGFGASDRPDIGYDKRTVAEDVHQLVHQLGLGPTNLVSHDVGMMVGYAYASAYPSEVKRLVLMEAALPGLGLEKLYDADKYPRMYHLPLFEAPNGLAEALITGREKMFVWHFMRQQAYNTAALEDDVLDAYAERLAAPGALRAGIAYFRAHKIDAEHNRKNAQDEAADAGPDRRRHRELRRGPRRRDSPAGPTYARRHDRELRALPGRRAAGARHGRTSALLSRRRLSLESSLH